MSRMIFALGAVFATTAAANGGTGYIGSLPTQKQEQIKNALSKVVPSLIVEANRDPQFKATLETKCDSQLTCFQKNSKLALASLAYSGNIKSKSIGAVAITGAFKSCFPKFNRTQILAAANLAINNIATGANVGNPPQINFKKDCKPCGGDAAQARFNEVMKTRLQKKMGALMANANIASGSFEYGCIGSTLMNSRSMLWSSGIFGEADEQVESDAITGALMACQPKWPRAKVVAYVAKYITADPEANDEAANSCAAGPTGEAKSYIGGLPPSQQQAIKAALLKVVPALANVAEKDYAFKSTLQSKCQCQLDCFGKNSKFALAMLAYTGNIKSKEAASVAITGAFRSCFPKFNRSQILAFSTEAIGNIANGVTPTTPPDLNMKQDCVATSGDAAGERFKQEMETNLKNKIGALVKKAKLTTDSPIYKCIGMCLLNSRLMLWKSGLYGEGNEDLEADAITGALMACKPKWPHDNVKSFVATYITTSNTALDTTSKLFPAMLHLPRFENQEKRKVAITAAVAGIGLFVAGVAVGKRMWGASRSEEHSTIELSAETNHLLQ